MRIPATRRSTAAWPGICAAAAPILRSGPQRARSSGRVCRQPHSHAVRTEHAASQGFVRRTAERERPMPIRIITTHLEFEGRVYEQRVVMEGEEPPVWGRDAELHV